MSKKLRPCKSCGAQIASTATKCPQCGQSFANFGTSALAVVGWTSIVFGGVCFFGGNKTFGIVLILLGVGFNLAGEALKRSLR